MAKYTLKTLCGNKAIETFDHRVPNKLRSILSHPRHHRAGEKGPWGEEMNHPDTFKIYDSQREVIFHGNIEEALLFVQKLR